MRISTKGRYALRLMLDLAMEENGKPVSIKDIAGRQGISEKYLEQIISSLNKAGYVKSVRGAQGGLSSENGAKGLYRRDDPSGDRGEPGSGRLCGRRKL